MKRVAILLLGGCTLYFGDDNRHQVSDPPPPLPSPPESTPRQEFDQNVAPILSAKCAACHVGGSIPLFGNQNTSDSYYTAIVANPELNGGWIPGQSDLFIKGVHEGPALTATEAAAISQWLIDEGKVRGTVPDPTPAPDSVEAQWAACISVSTDLLMASGGYAIASQQSASGSCASCHSAGGPVVFGTADAMIASWSTRTGLEQMFVPQVQADGSYRMQLDEANLDNKGQEQSENTGTHPSYLLDTQVIDGLDTFVVEVQARLDAGGCPAPSSSF